MKRQAEVALKKAKTVSEVNVMFDIFKVRKDKFPIMMCDVESGFIQSEPAQNQARSANEQPRNFEVALVLA